MRNQISIKRFCEAVAYNNYCLPVADIVKVSQHVQSGHPDKPLGRILDTCENALQCDWLLAASYDGNH